ncbi:MAG: hypothetical protein KGP28_05865 [Bdellovibrionales bacterium]|nr:hypothetical protein [Bdellovibrionales bacterium]
MKKVVMVLVALLLVSAGIWFVGIPYFNSKVESSVEQGIDGLEQHLNGKAKPPIPDAPSDQPAPEAGQAK